MSGVTFYCVRVFANEKYKTGFAVRAKMPTLTAMENPEQVFEEARRAGIDLDLVDSNLALTYEQRVLRHESALELMLALREAGAAYAKSTSASTEIR